MHLLFRTDKRVTLLAMQPNEPLTADMHALRPPAYMLPKSLDAPFVTAPDNREY